MSQECCIITVMLDDSKIRLINKTLIVSNVLLTILVILFSLFFVFDKFKPKGDLTEKEQNEKSPYNYYYYLVNRDFVFRTLDGKTVLLLNISPLYLYNPESKTYLIKNENFSYITYGRVLIIFNEKGKLEGIYYIK